MRHRWWVVGALVVLVGCSKKSSSPGTAAAETGSGSGAVAEGSAEPVGSAAAPAATDAAAAPASIAAAIEAAFVAAKLTLQPLAPDATASEPTLFMGWSKDGASYLARATYEIAEDVGVEGGGFSLVQIRDTLSQQVVATYQDRVWPDRKGLERVVADASPDDAKRVPLALWDAAKPASELAAARANFVDLGKLIPGKPGPHAKREGANGSAITASLRGKAPHKSKVELAPEGYGYSFTWTGFKVEPDGNGKTPRPAIEIAAKTQAGTFPLVTATFSLGYETLHAAIDEHEPTLGGEIRTHWSPTGTHVALNVVEIPEGGHEEMSFGLVTRAFVRSVGPQIKVVTAGASHEIARKAAAVFTHAGHPVTQVEQGTSTMTGAVIYYRGDAGKQTAEALAKLVPGARTEVLAKPGWLDVIVTLGT